MLKKIATFLLIVGAVAALIASEWAMPNLQLRVGERPKLQAIDVKAKDLQLVCPGSAFRSGGSSGTKVGQFDRVGEAVSSYASNLPAGVTLSALGITGTAAKPSSLANTATGASAVSAGAGTNSYSITVQDPAGVAAQSSQLVTAQSFQVVSSAAMNGAMAANCQRPASEQWLLGANTTIGREALLILTNPSATDATVDLQLYGANGSIDGAGLSGISVSANRYSVLPIASFATDQSVLAIHVTSKGAALATWVQQRTVRGTLAAGADLISPSTPAATNLVIPGLFKRGSKDASTLIAGNINYSDLSPALAVFVPGASTATVTVQVVGTDSKTFGTVAQQQVGAGAAGLIPLNGIKDGNYAIFVSSDQPVLAAARLSRTNATKTPNTDFAWLPAVSAGSAAKYITVPGGTAISKLSIANPNAKPTQATITDVGSGSKSTVAIPGLGSVVVQVAPGALISVSGQQPVSASLVMDFDWQLAVIGLVDYQNLGGSVSVLVR